ncbi:P-loop containing nucleoside triphosphate hydrolase protein [Infundibulicybe gibba]|nr:P-loop containing nucleoside triphosphate hydrolase protein [Infundibulicybe gibba]
MSSGGSSTYSIRNSTSIPAPLEIDSDSDFNPGAFVPEPKKKTKRTKGSGASSSNKRRRTTRDDTIRFFNTSVKPSMTGSADDLDLHSASDGENQGTNETKCDEEYESQDEVSSSENEAAKSDDPPPATLKTLAVLRPGNPKNQQAEDISGTLADESATESESEPEPGPESGMLARSSPLISSTPESSVSNKHSNVEGINAIDSATESDSGEELFHLIKPSQSNQKQSCESVTESESEAEIPANPRMRPRPGFPLAPGQTPLGPLILGCAPNTTRVPAAINTYLRDYQREGIKFLWNQYQEGRGGLLGDDMGLVGWKTIQVISFLSAIMGKEGVSTDYHRRRNHVSRLQDGKAWRQRRELPPADATWPTCLIIAPSTVVHNWEREFETWGYFEVGLYNGSQKEREPVLNDFKMGRLDVVLTTFDLARLHRVKNVSAKITVAFHRFRCERRFGLTGTTIQNSYNEMWTILDWTNPGRLGTARQWHGFVVKPLTAGQSAGSTEEERAKALLPEKTDQVVFCPLTPKQIAAYKRLLSIDAPCPCGSQQSRKACCHPFVPGDVFRYTSILIKLSNHLGLILPAPNDTPEQTIRNRSLAEVAFPDGDIPKYGAAMMQPQFCGKWVVLETLLMEWRKDHSNKVLIFTKSVKLLDMLEFHLKARGYGFLKLDGTTKQADRMPMIDKFHSDPEVFLFLISTLAGGTGLNLTGANRVVIFERVVQFPSLHGKDPAHDSKQWTGRAFRFGQTRDVAVFRLLGAGSVEELIYARQIYKQQQMAIGYEASVQTRYFEGIQGDVAKKGELFGIENIFKLHENKLATKMAVAGLGAGKHGGSRLRKTDKNSGEDWILEADTKGGKEDGNLRGLGALLFDDAPPLAGTREQDVIQKTLNAIGVQYSHLNDEILMPSRIEEERTKNTLLQTRKRKGRTSTNQPSKPEPSPQPQWPPRRKHHKPPPTPEEQLASRQQALIELGMITSPSDAPTFARDFARQPTEVQKGIIAELDKWARMQAE